MKVVVTGGNGYIGCALKKRFESYKDIEMKSITIDYDESGENLYTDFSIESLTRHFLNTDVVVHLAAVRGGKKISDFLNNENITENVLRAMHVANVHHFVFMSSIAVYSDVSLLPWKEIQPCTPVSLYGISKLACENMFCYYAQRYGLRGMIFRMAPVYGEKDSNRRMIADFVRQAANGKALTVNGKSISKREFIYIEDAISALEFGIRSQLEGVITLNIGSGERLTNYQIAQIVNEAFGNKQGIQYYDNLPENMPSAYMDISKATAIGYVPTYNMKIAMMRIADSEEFIRH